MGHAREDRGMTPWRRDGDDLVAEFVDIEVAVLQDLAAQVAELLESDEATDPARARLLPDAYLNDPDSAAEFRRLTENELAARKASAVRFVAESVGPAVRLDTTQSLDWLRALTDIRLVIASRLGIENDGDEGDDSSDEARFLRNAFDWLGFLQDSMLQVVDA